MHELSIAMSVVEAVGQEVARSGGGRVTGVTLRVGALSGVDPAALRFAFPEATAGTALAGARLAIDAAAGRELEILTVEVEEGEGGGGATELAAGGAAR